MISFVDLVLGCVLGAAAPALPSAPVAPDSTWVARVAAAVAARWSVPAEALHLTWGRLPAQGLPVEPAALRLLGGADGWFVVSLAAGAGQVSAVRVRAGVDDTVCVAARDLARGARLGADDLRAEARVRWGAPLARLGVGRPAPGWELRRAVTVGAVVDRAAAAPPSLISAGQRIDLWWKRGDVALRLCGVALHGARLGEPVRVRVDGRARPLTGIVDAPGSARLGAQEAS